MNLTRRRGTVAFFITLGVCLTTLAVLLNIEWAHISGRRFVVDLLGFIFFALLIAGVVLNTVFLVREIRRNERQNSFLNAVTHELKTPVASIRLYLDTLERRSIDDAQRAKFYGIMRQDTDRLMLTVEQVLKAGELGQRRRSHAHSTLELFPLLAECVSTTLRRHGLEPEAIQLRPTPGDVRLYVSGNADDLRTAVLNLLDNAVKYSAGEPRILCSLAIQRYTGVVLTIRDHGIGISPRELKRIFRRFYRVGTSDLVRIKGTGLGLFLVRTIARQHGGDVRALSEGLGHGTTMLLELPLVPPGQPASAEIEGAPVTAGADRVH